MADSLQLIHFHIGSQVTNIRRIKTALKEASQFYVELKRMGYNINFVDIGGGLGVDYDGTRSATSNSMNYSIQEYVNDAVSSIVDACEKNELPQPNIITESGRSLTAHHSVLVFEALASTSLPAFDENEDLAEDAHELVKELYDLWENLNQPRLLETWHDALQCREDALNLFNLGLIDLRTRAQVERLFWSVAREVYEMAEATKHAPDELKKIAKMLPDKYFCNFSLFQSLPDSWAIDQIFPIMPISRLNEQPTKSATIQDITWNEKVAKLSIVGAGMMSNPGVAAKMFESLYNSRVNINMISTSEIRITVLVPEEDIEKAMNAVHDGFGLGA